MICLLSALAVESKLFISALENRREECRNFFRWYRGTLWGQDVVVSVTGVGKIMAAAACQAAVDRFKPDAVIFTGAGGAINKEISVGDLVVATDCVQYDLNLKSFGFAPGEIPRSGMRFFSSDKDMVAAAVHFRPSGYNVVTGRVLTGDVFLDPDMLDIHGDSIQELSGDAVDMEGAAAACAATMNGIPYLLIRYITDQVEAGPSGKFLFKIKTGSKRCFDLVHWIMKNRV